MPFQAYMDEEALIIHHHSLPFYLYTANQYLWYEVPSAPCAHALIPIQQTGISQEAHEAHSRILPLLQS